MQARQHIWNMLLTYIICGYSGNLHASKAFERLGRTHFIDRLSRRMHRQLSESRNITSELGSLAPKSTPSVKCLFSDQDNLRTHFIRCVTQEVQAIDIAAFVLTDVKIAEALKEADERGVAIRLLVDKSLTTNSSHKLDLLKHGKNTQLVVYNPPVKGWRTPTLHHKYALFYQQQPGKSLVWNGSYNFTRKASEHNEENATILTDKDTFESFKQNFERLLSRYASSTDLP